MMQHFILLKDFHNSDSSQFAEFIQIHDISLCHYKDRMNRKKPYPKVDNKVPRLKSQNKLEFSLEPFYGY